MGSDVQAASPSPAADKDNPTPVLRCIGLAWKLIPTITYSFRAGTRHVRTDRTHSSFLGLQSDELKYLTVATGTVCWAW